MRFYVSCVGMYGFGCVDLFNHVEIKYFFPGPFVDFKELVYLVKFRSYEWFSMSHNNCNNSL